MYVYFPFTWWVHWVLCRPGGGLHNNPSCLLRDLGIFHANVGFHDDLSFPILVVKLLAGKLPIASTSSSSLAPVIDPGYEPPYRRPLGEE